MLPATVARMPADLVARDFGEEFAKRLEALPLNVWHGPIASGMGAHLVRITERQPAQLPALAAVRPQVLREWENDRRERNRAEVYQTMLKNYKVVIAPEVPVTVLQAMTGATDENAAGVFYCWPCPGLPVPMCSNRLICN